MSLDFSLTVMAPSEVLSVNVTHNLGEMARAAGLYKAMWRPQELGQRASHLIPYLEAGIKRLREEKEEMIKLNPSNGWGSYEQLLAGAEYILAGCREYPDAEFYACV